MMRERKSNESGISMAVDHNWSRREQRSCVQNVGDVSSLYYPEKETGDSTRPAQRVVAIEDMWHTLVGVLSHGGRQRMEKYLIEHGTHVPRPMIQLFLDLCQTCSGGVRGGIRKLLKLFFHYNSMLLELHVYFFYAYHLLTIH